MRVGEKRVCMVDYFVYDVIEMYAEIWITITLTTPQKFKTCYLCIVKVPRNWLPSFVQVL